MSFKDIFLKLLVGSFDCFDNRSPLGVFSKNAKHQLVSHLLLVSEESFDRELDLCKRSKTTEPSDSGSGQPFFCSP